MKISTVDLKFLLVFLTILLINFSFITSAQSLNSINFYHSYEGDVDLDSLGYTWNPQKPGNSIEVLISSDFSYTGDQSLVIESYAYTPVTHLSIPINLEYSSNHFFSLYFYSYRYRISVIRLTMLDAFNQEMSLDYESGTSWEAGSIFNVGVDLPKDEWFQLSRNITADVERALDYPDPYYPDGFVPEVITELFIFQPYDDGLHVNFIDDLIFADTRIEPLVFSGNDDLTKYYNIGNVDPLSFRTENPERTLTEGANQNDIQINSDLGLPISGLQLGLIIGIPLVITTTGMIVVRLNNYKRPY